MFSGSSNVSKLEDLEKTFPEFGEKLRQSDFVLDYGYTFLNHGYKGAVPKPVIAAHQRFIDEMRSQPSNVYLRRKLPLWTEGRDAAAKFLHASQNDMVLVQSVTNAINTVLMSLPLKKGDTILITNQSYLSTTNACSRILKWFEGVNTKYITFKLPINSEDDVITLYKTALDESPSIRVVVIDYVSCVSGMMLPVKKILQLCRKYDVFTIIDGAHAPGQIPLSLDTMEVDFFIGSFYKWMFCPWGCSFVWQNRNVQLPLVPTSSTSSREEDLVSQFCLLGTSDDTCCYSIPTAIEYIESKGGLSRISDYNTRLLEMASSYLVSLWNTNKLEIPKTMEAPFVRMVRLPKLQNYETSENDADRLMDFMFEKYDIDIAVKAIDDNLYVRLSVQIYNCMKDYKKLGEAVTSIKS